MTVSTAKTRSRAVTLWIAVSVAALVLRIALIPISPKYGYWEDHDDFVRWGIQAADEGVLSLYDHPPPRHLVRVWNNGKWEQFEREFDRLCNYPPLSAYTLWCSGKMFVALSDDSLINTTTSRAVFAGWSILGDFLLAWGCASLVAFFKPGRAGWWTYLIVLFAPPLWWDSVVWGQVDMLALAPAVWMLRAMVARRWVWAGVAFGIAAALKPQAILFVPVWGMALLTFRPIVKPVLSLLLAVAVFMLVGLPFTLHSGWAWLHSSYIANVVEAYNFTTMGSFNLWYVDLLICDSLDAGATWGGISKDTWGKGLLIVAMGAAFMWMLWRWRREPRGLLLWAAFSLMLFVMLPTRVHERYLLWMLPLAVAAAMLWARLWPACLMLLLVATAQVTWPVWLKTTPGQWPQREDRVTRVYEQRLQAVPPAYRNDVPRLEEVLAEQKQQYREGRAKTEQYEWFFAILGLAAMLTAAGTVVSIKPGNAATT